MFGGQGAEVQGEDSHPLTAETDGPQVTGPCATPPPPGESPLLDDFEDGNNQLFKTYHREGWWFTATDGSPGEVIEPPKSGFTASPLPPEEATDENEMAVHFKASGQTDWGASLGTTLRWKRDDLTCGFNASAFDGIEFRAKGPGTVQVKFSIPATTPPENGGVCEERCWDTHTKVIRLKKDWKNYVVRFEQLQQGGWGADARFEPERLLSLNFHLGASDLPADFWIDDLRFIEKGKGPVNRKHGPKAAPVEEPVAPTDEAPTLQAPETAKSSPVSTSLPTSPAPASPAPPAP